MGMGVTFTGLTAEAVGVKIAKFEAELKRLKIKRRINVGKVIRSAKTGGYIVAVDICGTPSDKINSIAKSIEIE